MQLGKALDVQLVDNGLVPWRARRPVVPPGKGRIDDHGQGGIRRVIPLVKGQVGLWVAQAVAEEFVGPAHITANSLGIGVEHDLVRIEAVPLLGLIGAMDAIAIELAG